MRYDFCLLAFDQDQKRVLDEKGEEVYIIQGELSRKAAEDSLVECVTDIFARHNQTAYILATFTGNGNFKTRYYLFAPDGTRKELTEEEHKAFVK